VATNFGIVLMVVRIVEASIKVGRQTSITSTTATTTTRTTTTSTRTTTPITYSTVRRGTLSLLGEIKMITIYLETLSLFYYSTS
jgi:hypothetical protein